jgi:hypothetical protein
MAANSIYMKSQRSSSFVILCGWMLLFELLGGAGRFSCCVDGLIHHNDIEIEDATETSKMGNNFLHQEKQEEQREEQQEHRSLLGSSNFKQNFQVAKAKMAQKFKQDYGADYYDEFFMINDWANGTARVTQGRRFFVSPSVDESQVATHENDGPSWKRMVRRLALKILEAQSTATSISGISNKPTFIWAMGGHSSAAGHGNYYNESHTAVMERSAKGVFEAVGLDFIGKNYAMYVISSCLVE